jgi:hypothetical protein
VRLDSHARRFLLLVTPMFSGRFGVQRKTGPVEARQGRNELQLLVRHLRGVWSEHASGQRHRD